MHQVNMRHIAICKHDLLDRFFTYHFFELVFWKNRNPVRINRPAQGRWITARFNPRYLCRGECDDLVIGIAPKADVKCMKISARGAENQYMFTLRHIRLDL